MKLWHTFLIVGALTFVHCGGTQQGVRIEDETDVAGKESTPWNEDFDPLSLKDYKLNIEPRKAKVEDVVTVEQLLRGGGETDTVSVGREIPGFRVQLISTRDEEAARSVMRNAVISFSENVYREYDNPYYKIRVGDFKSRYEASLLQEKAIELGFHEAWVVRAIIWDGPQKKSQNGEDEKF